MEPTAAASWDAAAGGPWHGKSQGRRRGAWVRAPGGGPVGPYNVAYSSGQRFDGGSTMVTSAKPGVSKAAWTRASIRKVAGTGTVSGAV